MYACMHVCMYACMHVCMYACMHACMYACMHVCMHVCMCVWTKRIGHLGFEFSNELAQSFIWNSNCVAKDVKPFVLTAVLKTVCNAWPTSRRYGHNNASHCRVGCFAVAGGVLRHYPFCPVVEGFVRSEGDIGVCLWVRNRWLGHFLLLHPVKFEAMVTSSLWADIIFQVVNSARNSSASWRGADFLYSRYRTVLARVPLANRALMGHSLCD